MEQLGNRKVFANNLQYQIELHELTIKEFSKNVNVKYGTVLDWLHCRTYPRMDKIQKVADYFGIKKSELIDDWSEPIQELERSFDSFNKKRLLQLVSELSDSDVILLLDMAERMRMNEVSKN